MKQDDTQALIERLSTLLRTETRQRLLASGLQPVQFEALHYLSMCNRYSDTPMAVTEYLGQTKGTVSQTLKVLEKNGLVEKIPDTKDRRVTHLKVTAQGETLINSLYPSVAFEQAKTHLSQTELDLTAQGLRKILSALQQVNDLKTFGLCVSCKHHQKQSGEESLCGLTGELLTQNDAQLICREHEVRCGVESGMKK